MESPTTWLLRSLDASYFIGELVLGAVVWAACSAFPGDNWSNDIMLKTARAATCAAGLTLLSCLGSLEERSTLHRYFIIRSFHLLVGCGYLVSGTAGTKHGALFTSMVAQACGAFHLSHFVTFLTCDRRIERRFQRPQ